MTGSAFGPAADTQLALAARHRAVVEELQRRGLPTPEAENQEEHPRCPDHGGPAGDWPRHACTAPTHPALAGAVVEGVVDDRRTWEEATEQLDPLARDLARRHAPQVYDRWRSDLNPECSSCRYGEHDDPDRWPCEDAEVVLAHLHLDAAAIRPGRYS